MDLTNLFVDMPSGCPEECFETLATSGGARVERIVSRGHATPAGQWFDQAWDEWVMVVRGAARLRVEGHEGLLDMGPGDAVLLPAHRRHRVEWTDPDQPTVWLAVHFGGE